MDRYRDEQYGADQTARTRSLVRFFFGAVTLVMVVAIVASSTWTQLMRDPFPLVVVLLSASLFALASKPSQPSAASDGDGPPWDGPAPSGDRSPRDGRGPTLEGAAAVEVPSPQVGAEVIGIEVDQGPTVGRAETVD